MSASRRFLLAGLALLASGTSPLPAQTSTSPGEPFSERVEVNVVDVDVYVTDRNGNPVQGLKKEDFQVFEDGRAVPVVNFYAESGKASPRPASPPAPAAAAPPPPAAEPPPSPTPESQRLHLAVYVDNWSLTPFHRNRVLRQLRAFLRDRLGPDDQVMLVTYDRALHVRHPFAAAAQAVEADLAALEKLPGNGIQRASERRQIFQLLQEEHDIPCDQKERLVDAYVKSRYNDEAVRVNALRALVASLAGIEGRKALLYVSDALALWPGAEASDLLQEVCDITPDRSRNLSGPLRRLTVDANARRVTLYTLEAVGAPPPPSSSIESAGGVLPSSLEFFERSNNQDGLHNLASETGGRAILQTNDLAAPLAKVAQDLRSYYSLGYTPGHQGDNREHAIQVKVKRPDLSGITVRHRQTYRDQPAAERLEERLMASLLHGLGDNPLGAALEIGAPALGEKQTYTVPVKVKLPLEHLVFLPQTGFAEARLRVLVVARDDQGRTTPIRRLTVPIRIPQARLDAAKGQLYVYELKLQLEKGGHTVAVGIEDEAAASTSLVNGRVEVKG
jgi:VWFA-related protein